MSTTLVQHVLDDTSKTPTTKVHAFLDRPALGVVQLGDDFAIMSRNPERLYGLADAALKAAKDLEQQIAADQVAKAAREACAAGLHGYCVGQHHSAQAG